MGRLVSQNIDRVEDLVYFTSPTIAEALENIARKRGYLDLMMDGTLEVVPQAGGVHQFFMIHLISECHVSVL